MGEATDGRDRRALSPLSWSHVRLYGTFTLDMDTRLDFDRDPDRPAPPSATQAVPPPGEGFAPGIDRHG